MRSALWLVLGGVIASGGIGIALALKRTAGNRQTYALPSDVLVHGNRDLKEVALTIDDGPKPETARDMLNILGRYGVRATFFVVGSQVEKHPALVRRMMAEGHDVANHTYSHPRLAGMDGAAIKREIAECDKSVFKATGANTALFRPPGMRYDDLVLRTAQDLGYITIHWNTAAQDFAPQPPEEIVRKITEQTSSGSVILLHGHPDTVKAMPAILENLLSRGFRFVTVSQMLARLPRPVIVKTNAYASSLKSVESHETAVAKRPERRSPSPKRFTLGIGPRNEPKAIKEPIRGMDLPTEN